MPFFVEIELDPESGAEEVGRRLKAIPTEPLYREIGDYMVLETDDRFVKEEAPDGTPWEPLSPATLAAKTTDKILQEKGTKGGLRGNIRAQLRDGGVAVGVNKLYGRVHQLGFEGDVRVPAHTRTITQAFGRPLDEPVEVEAHTRHMKVPARPFLGVSEENRAVIGQMIRRYARDAPTHAGIDPGGVDREVLRVGCPRTRGDKLAPPTLPFSHSPFPHSPFLPHWMRTARTPSTPSSPAI